MKPPMPSGKDLDGRADIGTMLLTLHRNLTNRMSESTSHATSGSTTFLEAGHSEYL